MAIELTQEIGRRITTVTEDTQESTFLFQHLSIALQPGECGLLPEHDDHRVKRRCNHFTFLTPIFTPTGFVLVGIKIIIIFRSTGRQYVTPFIE